MGLLELNAYNTMYNTMYKYIYNCTTALHIQAPLYKKTTNVSLPGITVVYF